MAGGEMSPASLRKLLSSLGAHDLVESIKDAIAIAACNYPRELEQSLGRSIPELLAATPVDEPASLTEKVDDDDDDGIKKQHDGQENRSASTNVALTVTEQVARINSRLASEGDGSDVEAVLESLRELKAVRMTFEALQETKIGRTVAGLRKQYASSEEVRELAGDLYKGWKALADEHYSSRKTSPALSKTSGASIAADDKAKTANPKPTATTSKPRGSSQETQPAASCGGPKVVERVRGSSPPTSSPSATKAKEVATRRPDPFGSSAGERKEAPARIDEARMATAKRKLQEGYKEAEAVKKQKRVQFIAAPGRTSQRPAVQQGCVVRRTAAVTGKRVPAPSSLPMCRAS